MRPNPHCCLGIEEESEVCLTSLSSLPIHNKTLVIVFGVADLYLLIHLCRMAF